jgi:SAM-dependent methyltransferase
VTQPLTCRVCARRLELFRRGRAPRFEPATFRPSFHRAGAHGDLYRCPGCGTVQQTAFPRGEQLHALYRASSDDLYLAEERGRRRTARRLLDVLAAHVASGRLLQVGCGHGLLLDEARRRGYQVQGVELSAAAARHAREQLGLDVREQPLEQAALAAAAGGERYDAILAVDVLEHLEDPLGAIERLGAVLAPAGALLITTPDPSSFAARVTGARWWGYEPAHTCLMPRRTLREAIRARGLTPVQELAERQSFTLAYWLRCLSQRGEGLCARTIAGLAARLPRRLMLTASLGDELVLLACRSGPGVQAPSLAGRARL